MVSVNELKDLFEKEEELKNDLYIWLTQFFLLDFPISEIPVEFFEENNCRILFKSPEEIKKHIIKHQALRQQNLKDMINECFTNGESKKFAPLKSIDGDFILELNLIKLDDIKAEDYYKSEKK